MFESYKNSITSDMINEKLTNYKYTRNNKSGDRFCIHFNEKNTIVLKIKTISLITHIQVSHICYGYHIKQRQVTVN